MQTPHHEMISTIDRHLQQGSNLANISRDLNLSEHISPESLPSILHEALIQTRAYSCLSFNLSGTTPHWRTIYQKLQSTRGLDCVVAYYRVEQAPLLINPFEEEHWKEIGPLAPGSLMVVYIRSLQGLDRNLEPLFLKTFKSVCSHNPAPEGQPDDPQLPLPAVSAVQETTRYAIPVTNGFFHYGNVEAWRNIIEHYQDKYPNSKVHIFHREKPVHRIGSLFKWGKVSVGDVIQISVAGPEFKDIAKLKKYLTIAASPRFFPFIKKHLTDSLNLF
jgi:hypothetical protein